MMVRQNAVLNVYSSIMGSLPSTDSANVKEEYATISLVMEKVQKTYAHLKMINFLLGQQYVFFVLYAYVKAELT